MALVWPSVAAIFLLFSQPLEGTIYHLYADKDGNVTAATGYLADPLPRALALPLKQPDGQPATASQVAAEFDLLHKSAAAAKGGAPWAQRRTLLRLDQDDVRALTAQRMNAMADALTLRFPAFPTWPADAQLALLSWAWAVGTDTSGWPKMSAALEARDFLRAGEEMQIRAEENPGVVPRNQRNRQLMQTASLVDAQGHDPSAIYTPVPVAAQLPAPPPPGDLAGIVEQPSAPASPAAPSSGGDGGTAAGYLALLVAALVALSRRRR